MGIEEIIVSIHDAEAKADGILSDAADEARNVQIKAEEEAERIKKKARKKLRKTPRLWRPTPKLRPLQKAIRKCLWVQKRPKKFTIPLWKTFLKPQNS